MSANKNTSKDNMKATRKRIAWVTSHPIFILNYLIFKKKNISDKTERAQENM